MSKAGSGGTTMAMQVLWDLRKTFRCAVLTDSSPDTTKVAQEVVDLFIAGSKGHQNTVLLLLNDEQILDKLQENIMMTIKERKINKTEEDMPVAILLSCVRKDVLLQSENVFLRRDLSENEQQRFTEKKNEITANYGNKRLHGFYIMQTNFSQNYINKACQEFRSRLNSQLPPQARLVQLPPQARLIAFLSLLNAYVSGSYLLESQCLDFLQHENNTHENISMEKEMHPYSDLIVTFHQDERTERKVRMAHSLLAKCCISLLAERGVTRSHIAKEFLNTFPRHKEHEEFPPCLLGFIKDLLTKREPKTKKTPYGSEVEQDKERFSKLILDIQENEDDDQSASLLEVASEIFPRNPFFPQALARFYYIELKSYVPAEHWANKAKSRDPQNSFIADTLGQVHKNHLKNSGEGFNPSKLLEVAKKATEAFKDEERLARIEHQTCDNRVPSRMFNCRGQFGFLQFCNLLYNLLVKKNKIWEAVLTQNVSLDSVLNQLGDDTYQSFNDLVNRLKGEVEKKAEFFVEYLTYSKPSMEKDDPGYLSKDTSECQRKYIGDSPPLPVEPNVDQYMHKLQDNLAATSAGVLACMDREYTGNQLKHITTWWEKICSSTKSDSDVANFILAYVLSKNLDQTFSSSPEDLIQGLKQRRSLDHKAPPEQHLLALLLCWPTDNEDNGLFDLSQLIQEMRSSYENVYLNFFRSRYLLPLFFIGKGQDLDRLVHRKVLEKFYENQFDADCINWKKENIFKNHEVKECLLKFEGKVKDYTLFLTIGSKQIEIEANLQRSLWKERQVSFFLGFTIRGPVAFNVQTKTTDRELSKLESPKEA
ncbi:sterile alpha motif domain-containing protein 9-like [Fundulus heteroclitus]|uniref:sterile alpha motif domain-containing protein 9-like n=1 Tax=Fundulus heteroclitus TaxID=8078 RepID=UPI00165B4017|nr:sterile alpha motif domain-containing protein 9-like [Fundulus heteroclitus]